MDIKINKIPGEFVIETRDELWTLLCHLGIHRCFIEVLKDGTHGFCRECACMYSQGETLISFHTLSPGKHSAGEHLFFFLLLWNVSDSSQTC